MGGRRYAQPMKTWLVTIAALLVLAAVVGGALWNEQRKDKRAEAEMFCTLDQSIPSIYSPEFKNCVDQYLD